MQALTNAVRRGFRRMMGVQDVIVTNDGRIRNVTPNRSKFYAERSRIVHQSREVIEVPTLLQQMGFPPTMPGKGITYNAQKNLHKRWKREDDKAIRAEVVEQEAFIAQNFGEQPYRVPKIKHGRFVTVSSSVQ